MFFYEKNPHNASEHCGDISSISGCTLGLAVVLLHHLDQVKHLVAIANLVVIP